MAHGHTHRHGPDDQPAPDGATDLTIPDGELEPDALTRRQMLRNAGLLGAGAAAASVLGGDTWAVAAPAQQPTRGGFHWLAGDHHIHTLYSADAIYRVIDQVRHGRAYGLDWMVITDHGGVQHARIGVEKVNPDIRAARDALPDALVYQGLEWNIPGAEHGTVFVHPGTEEVSVLKQFENDYDGSLVGAGAGTPQNEALAIAGLTFLADAVRARRVGGCIVPRQPPGPPGRRLATRDPQLARCRIDHRSRLRGRARSPGCRDRAAIGSRQRPRLLRRRARRRLVPRLPARELSDMGRIRLDDGHGRRPVGQPARRGQAMVDQRQLRRPFRLPRHRGTRAGQ